LIYAAYQSTVIGNIRLPITAGISIAQLLPPHRHPAIR
jgi:hypothetical protein